MEAATVRESVPLFSITDQRLKRSVGLDPVVGQFEHVGQDVILQRVVNPRSLRRLAIGTQVTNSYQPAPHAETDPLFIFLIPHIHSTRRLVYSGEVWTLRAARLGAG
jgi:hypothetical protein